MSDDMKDESPPSPASVFEDPTAEGAGTTGTTGTAGNHADFAVPDELKRPGTSGTNEGLGVPPAHDDRPCWRVYDESTPAANGTKVYAAGTYWHALGKSKGDQPPPPVDYRICGPLYVVAQTADGSGNEFGRLLRFKTTRGAWREWAMPARLLSGDAAELRAELLAMGLHIDPSNRKYLPGYLLHGEIDRRVECTASVGWCSGTFVFPGEVIGSADVVFQHEARVGDECSTKGTLDDWQREIAALAVGNPILMLALCAGFVGPLLHRCQAESGGVHLVGDSSCGKTSALRAATSVWGSPAYAQTWRATANGLEAKAALHNDGLLALDEISQCEPQEVGAVVYMIANGQGKQRASRTGSSRVAAKWRASILSTGEMGVGTAMEEGGRQQKAGQSVRLLDIPSHRTYGIYDELHQFDSGAALSDHLKRATEAYHGHAARAFVRLLIDSADDHAAAWRAVLELPKFSQPGLDQQELRAAARFALLAYAGELATQGGITGWPVGAATRAMGEIFKAWRDRRGAGRHEHRQALDAVRDFLDRHDSRFQRLCESPTCGLALDGDPVRDRAGFVFKASDEGLVYWFTGGGLREALRGLEFKSALDVIASVGALPTPGARGDRRVSKRIGNENLKLYPVNANLLREAAS